VVSVVQSIQKEHGLDNYQKVKKESVLEMVSFLCAETCRALTACRGVAPNGLQDLSVM
jgi:hypothetical protein